MREQDEKQGNQVLVDAFKKRLKEKAGFQFVAEPMPMRNSSNAIVYYLFFACQKEVALKIARHILKKYGNRKG